MWKVLANINVSVKNNVSKSLTFLCQPERHQATIDELHVLMQRLSRIITDMNALESEFLEHQATPDDEFPAYFDMDDKLMCIDHIWGQISKQIDLYSGQPCFKHLAEFAKFLLLIPHSIHILRVSLVSVSALIVAIT